VMKRRGVELRLVVENRASLRRIADMPDSMAERSEFEPPVPVLELSDDSSR
jgi:hypothetical protein